MTREEGNKLIAEFMGMRQEAADVWADAKTGSLVILGEYRPHADWNELMPVVEKIAQYGQFFMMTGYQVRLESFKPTLKDEKNFSFSSSQMDWEKEDGEPVELIFLVREVVIQFIQWYNTASLTTNKE